MADEKVLDGLAGRLIGGPDMLFPRGDSRILGWVREAVQEGDRVNQADPAYTKIDEAMAYILGDQRKGNRPDYLPNVVINNTKKAIRTHASALTDLRPLFQWKTSNGKFMSQAHILNQLIQSWWTETFADVELADVIKYASAAGCGDCLVEFDPHFGSLGDNRLIPRDPRDTLPIRPSRERSIQSWEGVIIRESHSPNALRAMYPDFADAIMQESSGSKWGQIFTKFRRAFRISTPSSTLDGLKTQKTVSGSVTSDVAVYRVFLHDRSRNLSNDVVTMGTVGSNWSYNVEPGGSLYPRGRLLICTETAVLYDGPNPYWHGMFPIVRLRLDPWPWSFFGLGLCNDLMPLQDAINGTTNDFLQTFSQWVNRGAVMDKNAVPEPVYRRLDTRKPNWKLRTNTTVSANPFQMIDGPTLPPWAMNFLGLLLQKHDELSETANLNTLSQLRQMPGADTIDTYYKALTPGLRLEGRLLESFMREVAQMIKVNIFQFYSSARRIMLMGDPGKLLDDLDYDPDSMVPAMQEGDEGYIPELDASLPRDVRAQFFHNMFAFEVAPNSTLALHSQEKKMLYLQLSRQGYMDFWTLMEMLEVPNVGAPPPIPLPQRDWDPARNLDPVSGVPMPPPLEIRVPVTVTERLQAQQMMGLGQTVSAAGRKATGQEPPQMKQRPDGSTTVTES